MRTNLCIIQISRILIIFSGLSFGQKDVAWESMFNGEDLTGWTIECRSEDDGKRGGFKVADSALSIDVPKGGGYMWFYHEKVYEDFHFKCKFQCYKDRAENSGVQFRSHYDKEDGGGWLNGPQADINPSGAWRTGCIWDETRNNQKWLYGSFEKNDFPAPGGFTFYFSTDPIAWNDYEIIAIGTKVQVILNGVTLCDRKTGEAKEFAVLADKNHADRQVGMKGHFALQRHNGDPVRIKFKDLYIKDFTNGKPLETGTLWQNKIQYKSGPVSKYGALRIFSLQGKKQRIIPDLTEGGLLPGLYVIKQGSKSRIKAVIR